MRRTLATAALIAAATASAGAQLVAFGPEIRTDGGDGGFALCPEVAGRDIPVFQLAWWKREAEPTTFTLRTLQFSGSAGRQTSLATGAFPLRWDLSYLRPGNGFRALWRSAAPADPARPWLTRRMGEFGAPGAGGQLRVPAHVEFLSARPGGGFVGAYRLPRAGWIVLQLFDHEGRKVGPERRLNASRLVDPGEVRFAHHADGSFVALFSGAARRANGTLDQRRLHARLVSAAGNPIGGNIVVSTTPPGAPVDFTSPRLAALVDGGFAAAWSREELGRQTIYLRTFAFDGAPFAPEAVVARGDESVAVFLDGLDGSLRNRVAVLWREEDEVHCDDVPCGHLFAQLFDNAGVGIADSVAVDTTATAPFDRALCGDLSAAGSIWVVGWLGWDFDENAYAIFVRRFADVTPCPSCGP